MKFWVPWTIDAIIAIIGIYFFIVGLADGSVSSFNLGLWLVTLLVLVMVVAGSLWLKSVGRIGPAIMLLLILTVPGVLFGIFMAFLVLTVPRWN